MTLLVGNNSSAGFTANTNYSNAQLWYMPFTAVASGTASTIYFYTWTSGNNANTKLCVWDGVTGALLASSSNFVQSSAGWTSAAISLSITSGNSYALGFVGDAYVQCNSDGVTNAFSNTGNTYTAGATPQNQTIPGSSTTGYGFPIYVDGASAPSANYLPFTRTQFFVTDTIVQ